MTERAAAVGGQLRAGPRPGGGYEVTARLPVEAARSAPSPSAPSPSAPAPSAPAPSAPAPSPPAPSPPTQ